VSAAEASTGRRKEERNEEATTESRSKKEEDELPSAVTVVEVPVVKGNKLQLILKNKYSTVSQTLIMNLIRFLEHRFRYAR
jgi:hypothetical protein